MYVLILIVLISLAPVPILNPDHGTPGHEITFSANQDVMLIDLNDPNVIVALPDGWII